MKRAFLLIVVSAMLVALGFAQTPAASINTDQTNIKGCLGGSDGNYTVVEDNTGHIFKITTSSVDLKSHLGHDVTVIGHKVNGAGVAAGNSFAVTELNMISEHCAAASAAPAATIIAPAETASTPAEAAAAPAAAVTTPAETANTPVVADAAPAATVSAPSENASKPAATAVAPAPTIIAPVETAITPAVGAAAPVATVSAPSETASRPAATAARPTRVPARPRRPAATAAAADVVAPPATASTSSETDSTPATAATTAAATESTSSETDSTPAAAATTPTATAKRGSLSLLIVFAVLVIVIGTLTPLLGRWRKRKRLERTGAPNLSFSNEASSDQGKSDPPVARKAA